MTLPAIRLLSRGVHTADYLIAGLPVLLAIDSGGNCLRRVLVGERMDADCCRVWLEGLLEHYDPIDLPPARLSLHSFPPPPRIGPASFRALLRH